MSPSKSTRKTRSRAKRVAPAVPGKGRVSPEVKRYYEVLSHDVNRSLNGNRTRSTAFLAWFLENIYRADPVAVDDAICDGGGDKGIDALLVDDQTEDIVLFQSKYYQSAGRAQGENDLKQLVGAAGYFKSPDALDELLEARPNRELRQLLNRHQIRDLLAEGKHRLRLVFVSSGVMNRDARRYAASVASGDPSLDVWDLERLGPVIERTHGPEIVEADCELTASVAPVELELEDDAKLLVALVPAAELVDLPGIDDMTIFDPNVRLSAGSTRINRELRASVADPEEHPLFAAYHNGMTMLTDRLRVKGTKISLDGVGVVNGCQSLLALYNERESVTDSLSVLVKIVQIGHAHGLGDRISYTANNQNPINMRDLRSNDRIQRDLMGQVAEKYGDQLVYLIKQGQDRGEGAVLDNQTAAQLILAIWREEPWNAVRKIRLFDQDYHRIFRTDIDADKLFLTHLIDEAARSVRESLDPELQSSFSSIRFTLAYLIAQAVASSDRGTQLLAEPGRWLPDEEQEVRGALDTIAEEVAESVNFHVRSEKEDEDPDQPYDPKTAFKSQRGVTRVAHDVERDFKRQTRRDDALTFSVDPVRQRRRQSGQQQRRRSPSKRSQSRRARSRR